MNKAKEYWHSLCISWAATKERRRAKALERESNQVLQVREFDGELCLCYNGVPLLTEHDMKGGIVDTLEVSRCIYRRYKEEE